MNETAAKINPEIELPSPPQSGNVAVTEPVNQPIEQGNNTIISLIVSMATNPDCDVDKFERLARLNKEMEKERRDETLLVQFNEALSRAQARIAPIVKDKFNTQTKSKYTSYVALDEVVRPIYTEEGFSLSFDEGETTKPEHIRILCEVSRGAYTRHYHRDVPADGKGAKGGDVMTKTHAVESAISYGQRSLLKMIFNLATRDDPADDDGNRAGSNNSTLTEKQVEVIRSKIVDSGADVQLFLHYANVERIEDIQGRHFKQACDILDKKKRATAEAKTKGKKS